MDDMEDDGDDDLSIDDHVILRLRNRLLSLLELCFSQYIPSSDEHGDDDTTVAKHSDDQIQFADYVQLAAGRTTSDLRVLFPKEYADAESPLLRSVALQEDGRLVGAFVRFINAKEHLLREFEESTESKMMPQSLLLPMGRAIVNNWAKGNRREAGVFLRHIASSGPTATAIVTSACDQMKKDDPVRMLESQMASLRQSYENWVEEEPDMENDAPSDEEMKEFEEAEARHKEQFEHLENRAAQFSKKLGVFGKLSDERKLRPALNGFIREGIRFSFSNLDNNGEDTLVLGSRLSFLSILSKYASWIKRDKPTKKEIQRFIDEKEVEMKNHEEFEEVHEDDLEALAAFRGTLGLKSLPKASANVAVASGDEDEEMDDEASDGVNELQSPVASVSSRTSKASRASSRASSRVSSLPALPEGKESPQDSDEESHFSAGSSSNKRKTQTQNTYENSDESDSDDSSIGLGYSQKSRKARRSK